MKSLTYTEIKDQRLFPSTPVHLDIDLTGKCNAYCRFCSASAGADKNKEKLGNLTPDVWLEFFRSLCEYPIFKVSLLGGEPLLVPKLEEMISVLAKHNIDVLLATNGYLLSESKLSKLKAAGLNRLQISLDSANSEEHDSSRGLPGIYMKILNAIEYAKKIGIDCVINFVLSKSTIGRIDGMLALGKKLSVPVSISEYKPIGASTGCISECLDIGDIKNLRDKYSQHLTFKLFFPVARQRNYCSVGIDRLYISEKGDIFPCEVYRQVPNMALGNILKDDISLIWNKSQKLIDLRNAKSKIESLKGQCINCSEFENCNGGCLALSYIYKNSSFLGDPRCN